MSAEIERDAAREDTKLRGTTEDGDKVTVKGALMALLCACCSCGACALLFVLFLVTLVFPFLMIITGAFNMNNCPVESRVPLWLLIGGSVYLVKCMLSGCKSSLANAKKMEAKDAGKDDPEAMRAGQQERKRVTPLDYIIQPLNLFLLVWFILGCVWVFSVAGKVQFENSDQPDYCGKWTFRIAQVLAVAGCIHFAIGIAAFFLICCAGVTAGIFSSL